MEIPCEYIYDDETHKVIVSNVDFSRSQKIANFNGDAGAPENFHHKVKVIFFDSCIMPNFPRGLTQFFPKLAVIQIASSGLKQITKEDLKEFPKLVYIGIIDNEITSLPGDLFEATPRVEFIDFSTNKISKISPMIFAPLKHVYGVSLRENKNIDAHYMNDKKDRRSVKSLDALVEIIKKNCRPLESLKAIAAQKLSENVTKENAAKVFFYGNRFNMTGMKRQGFKYLKKNVFTHIDESFYKESEKMIELIIEDVKMH